MCDHCGEAGHSHDHDHMHKKEHEHSHKHEHDHGNENKSVKKSVTRAEGDLLAANVRGAERTRRELTQRGIFLLNITSGAGSGKTSLLQATLNRLPEGSAAVLVGDLQTDRDAQRLRGLGAQVLQINTGKGCHLTAAQVAAGLDRLELDNITTVFVENVGNMACPAEYDLGEHARVTLLSLPEGDDKAAKYPGLFAAADVVLLNKVDLSEALAFDEALFRQDLAALNTRAPLIRVSARGGQGLDAWIAWLESARAKALNAVPAGR